MTRSVRLSRTIGRHEADGINDHAGTTALIGTMVIANTAVSGQGGGFGGDAYTFSGVLSLNDRKVSGYTPDNCYTQWWPCLQ